jgi:hypothetical protein
MHTLALIGKNVNATYGALATCVRSRDDGRCPRVVLKLAAAKMQYQSLNELPLNQANAEELQALMSAINSSIAPRLRLLPNTPVAT